MYSFNSYMGNDSIVVEVLYNGQKIATKNFITNYKRYSDGVMYEGLEAAKISVENDVNNYGIYVGGKYYEPVNKTTIYESSEDEIGDIKFDEELVEIGYSNMKIKFNIAEPIDKTMAAVYGFQLNTQDDYDKYKKDVKPNTSTVNPEKPGLATLFKQAVLTVGDILGFLFKLIKDAVDQIIKSFIMPILTPAAPYTLPIIIKNIIEIIQKIVEMVKEALTLITDTFNWLMKKVAGKIAEVKIPIPDFKIPLFGLSIAIPAFDKLSLLKVEPFQSLPSIKINNFSKQIDGIKKLNIKLPITELKEKMKNLDKIKDIGNEIDKLKTIKDEDVKNLEQKLNDTVHKIAKIQDEKNQSNKDFMDGSLNLMKSALDVLKSMLFMSTFDLSKTVIDMHNDVIIKKKELLDKYLKTLITKNKGTTIDLTDINTFSTKLKEQGIVLSNYNTGISEGVVLGNDVSKINTDINYVMNTTTSLNGINISYKTNYITYKFTNRLNIFTREYNNLDNNKKIVKKYKSGSKTMYNYAYNGDLDYLRYVSGFLIDELEKEELDLEEEINKYKIEDIPEYKAKIDELNLLINDSYIKKLKQSEQYRTPKLSQVEKTGYIKTGQQAPKEDVLVTELTVDGYRKRLIDQKLNVDKIIEQIKQLEDSIKTIEDRVNNSSVTGGGSKKDDTDIIALQKEKQDLETELNKKSPESVRASKLLELLLAIITFPITIIVDLLADLFGGIIDFITSLPLLNFEKLIKFFEKLFGLSSKQGISTLITDSVNKVTTITDGALKPITSAIDGTSECVSSIAFDYSTEITNIIPFEGNPVLDPPKIKEVPVIEDVQYYDENWVKMKAEQEASLGNNSYEKEFGNSYNMYNTGEESNSTYLGEFPKITPSKSNRIVDSYKLNTFHPQKRQKVFNDIDDMLTFLKKKYNTDIYMYITSVIGGKHKDNSMHYVGLAFDQNIFVYTGTTDKGLKQYKAINSIKDKTHGALSNPIMLDAVSFMKSRNWEWGGTYKGYYDPVHFELNPYDNIVRDLANTVPKLGNTIYPDLTKTSYGA